VTRRAVFLSPAAADDLEGVRVWYSQPGAGSLAKRRVQHILNAMEHLAEWPFIEPVGPEPDTRERVVEDHVVFYRVDPESGDIEVIRIWRPGQDRPLRR